LLGNIPLSCGGKGRGGLFNPETTNEEGSKFVDDTSFFFTLEEGGPEVLVQGKECKA